MFYSSNGNFTLIEGMSKVTNAKTKCNKGTFWDGKKCQFCYNAPNCLDSLDNKLTPKTKQACILECPPPPVLKSVKVSSNVYLPTKNPTYSYKFKNTLESIEDKTNKLFYYEGRNKNSTPPKYNSNTILLTESQNLQMSIENNQRINKYPIWFKMKFKINGNLNSAKHGDRIFLFGNSSGQLPDGRELPGFTFDIRIGKDERNDPQPIPFYTPKTLTLCYHIQDNTGGGDDRWGEWGKLDLNKWYNLTVLFDIDALIPRLFGFFNNQMHCHDIIINEGFKIKDLKDHINQNIIQIGGGNYYQDIWVHSSESLIRHFDVLAQNIILEIDEFKIIYDNIADSNILKNIYDKASDIIASKSTNFPQWKELLWTHLQYNTWMVHHVQIKKFLKQYEKVYGNITNINKEMKINELSELEYLVFYTKQWILDMISKDLSEDFFNTYIGMEFAEAAEWPGIPIPADDKNSFKDDKNTDENEEGEKEDDNFESVINFDFKDRTLHEINSGREVATRMTGFYAEPGKKVTINFPYNIIGKGIYVMVGIHYWNTYFMLEENKRLHRIATMFPVNSTTVNVINPMGGTILIRIPPQHELLAGGQYIKKRGFKKISFQNCIRTPYFSTKHYSKTDFVDWQNMLMGRRPPWIEMESDRVQLSFSSSIFLEGNKIGREDLKTNGSLDPRKILGEWDKIMKAFSIVHGRKKRVVPWLLFQECQPVAGGTAAPASNPLPLTISDWDSGFVDMKPTKDNFKNHIGFIILHEMGHAHNQMKELDAREAGTEESLVNLPAVLAYNMTYCYDISGFAMQASINQGLTLDEAAMDWMISDNFKNGQHMSFDPIFKSQERGYQSRGHAVYVDIASIYGWGIVGKIFEIFQRDWDAMTSLYEEVESNAERVVTVLLNTIGINLIPFFHFWGLITNKEAANLYKANLSMSNYKISLVKKRLIHYKNLIPKNYAEFINYYISMTNEKWRPYWLSIEELEVISRGGEPHEYRGHAVDHLDECVTYEEIESDALTKQNEAAKVRAAACGGVCPITKDQEVAVRRWARLMGYNVKNQKDELVPGEIYTKTRANAIINQINIILMMMPSEKESNTLDHLICHYTVDNIIKNRYGYSPSEYIHGIDKCDKIIIPTFNDEHEEKKCDLSKIPLYSNLLQRVTLIAASQQDNDSGLSIGIIILIVAIIFILILVILFKYNIIKMDISKIFNKFNFSKTKFPRRF